MKNHYLAVILNSSNKVLSFISGTDEDGTYEAAVNKANVTEGAADVAVVLHKEDRYIIDAVEIALKTLLEVIQPETSVQNKPKVRVLSEDKSAPSDVEEGGFSVNKNAIGVNLLKAIACMEYARTNEHYPLAKYYSQFVQQYTVAYNLTGETKTPPNLEGIQKEEFDRLMDFLS